MRLWLSLQVLGLVYVREMTGHGVELGKTAERVLKEREGWKVVSRTKMGDCVF